eukprot:1101111-Rhodomonas_salina.1
MALSPSCAEKACEVNSAIAYALSPYARPTRCPVLKWLCIVLPGVYLPTEQGGGYKNGGGPRRRRRERRG